MTENLKKVTSHLIEKYIDILEENGEPNETYKYLAINTFQQNWDLEAEDFHQMFRASFSKVSNLLYQNSWGFIEKSAQLFPNEVREMFRNLYDESAEISQRIKTFQTKSENILPQVRQSLNRTNVNAQQDERTISVYLAFRFPEKYMLYKADYYKNFCEQLNIKAKKSGERFLHLQELANQIIQGNLLNDNNFINTYRKFYQKPDWDDKYLMIQNVLYVVFREDFKDFNLLDMSKKYWLYAPGENACKWDEFHELGIMALGWDELGDIRQFNSRQEIKEALVDAYGGKGSKKNDVSANDDFVHKINIGDIIIAKKGRGELLGFGEVTSNYIYNEKRSEYNSIRKVDWKLKGNWKIDFSLVLKTLTDITSYPSEEDRYDTYYEKLLGIMTTKNSTTQNALVMNFPLNQILFGAPGTGKTYKLINEYFDLFSVKETSLTKEQFTESLIADLSWWQVITIALVDLKKAKVNQIHEHSLVKIKESISQSKTVRPTIWGQLQSHTVKECEFVNVEKRQDPLYFYKDENSYWTIKDELLDELYPEAKQILETYKNFKPSADKEIRNYEFVTFHQSFAYEDFIEGIKPDLNAETKELTYKVEDGIFKSLCNKARRDPDNKYAIFVDEINRGNVSAIFGELITLIEESKRAGNDDALEVTLPYSKDKFSVPNNVYVIGTMNTADRSVEALDTALRRRFSFVEIQPNPSVLLNSEYQDVDLKQLLETINQRIEVLVDKDHQIGHSYFIGIQNLEDLKLTFKDKIIPLLEEYFYGDFGKIGLVLGGSFIYQEENTAKFPKNFSYENDFLEDKKVYRFTPFEDWDEQTFISVYED